MAKTTQAKMVCRKCIIFRFLRFNYTSNLEPKISQWVLRLPPSLAGLEIYVPQGGTEWFTVLGTLCTANWKMPLESNLEHQKKTPTCLGIELLTIKNIHVSVGNLMLFNNILHAALNQPWKYKPCLVKITYLRVDLNISWPAIQNTIFFFMTNYYKTFPS